MKFSGLAHCLLAIFTVMSGRPAQARMLNPCLVAFSQDLGSLLTFGFDKPSANQKILRLTNQLAQKNVGGSAAMVETIDLLVKGHGFDELTPELLILTALKIKQHGHLPVNSIIADAIAHEDHFGRYHQQFYSKAFYRRLQSDIGGSLLWEGGVLQPQIDAFIQAILKNAEKQADLLAPIARSERISSVETHVKQLSEMRSFFYSNDIFLMELLFPAAVHNARSLPSDLLLSLQKAITPRFIGELSRLDIKPVLVQTDVWDFTPLTQMVWLLRQDLGANPRGKLQNFLTRTPMAKEAAFGELYHQIEEIILSRSDLE